MVPSGISNRADVLTSAAFVLGSHSFYCFFFFLRPDVFERPHAVSLCVFRQASFFLREPKLRHDTEPRSRAHAFWSSCPRPLIKPTLRLRTNNSTFRRGAQSRRDLGCFIDLERLQRLHSPPTPLPSFVLPATVTSPPYGNTISPVILEETFATPNLSFPYR